MPKYDFNKVAVFWKYAANLQENSHAEVRFQKSCKALNLFLGTLLGGCF